MRKKTFDRMVKKVHEINESPLSTPIQILEIKPLDQQTNYNPKLREWFGPRDMSIIAETTGIIEAFKESEDWKEIGTLGVHDYKCLVNDDIPKLNEEYITHCYVKRLDNNLLYSIIFYREYIGEVHLGLRPVVNDV